MDGTEKKLKNENFKKENKEEQFQLVRLMENQKELEKILSECLVENSRLKKKRSYWNTKCRKAESTEDVTLPTKVKDLHDQIKSLLKIKN